ncbi:MAG TPA: HAD family hydrolase [Pyrinomonadaceae bacterium]|nr:HAD family hydrolase [Pyrinomonadaceae bacterium]
MKKAVFLDRDGTVCEESNYLSNAEDLRVFPFASEAILLLKENGFLAILITNQSGIGRKFFDEKTLEKIHEKLQNELAEKLDAIYFCPHIAEDACNCRKPKTQMIEQAAADFNIDLSQSWMIGDKAIDSETGFNAGIKTALVLTGYGKAEIEKLEKKPDLIAENLLEAARLISER